MHQKKPSTYFLLLLLIGISILIRLPNMDRPLSKHHEFCNALLLVTTDVWYEGGIAQFNYSPVVNYLGPADRGINNGALTFMQRDGIHFYLSHPPLAYWLPYALLSPFGIKVQNIHLQLLNLLAHALSSLLLFHICLLLIPLLLAHPPPTQQKREQKRKRSETAALLGTTAYLFAPACLWYHGNVYMSDVCISFMWIATLFIALKNLWRKEENTALHYVLFILILVLSMLTEWLGFFMALGIFLYHLFNYKLPFYYRLKTVISCIVAVIIGFGSIVYIYGSILGIDTYIEFFFNRFGARTGQVREPIFAALLQVGKHYITAHLPNLIHLSLLLLALLYMFISKQKQAVCKAPLLFVCLFLLPLALHNGIFLNYTAVHEFAVTKAAIPISIILALLGYLLLPQYKKPVYGLTVLVILLCTLQYYYINRPGAYSWRGHRYDINYQMGQAIQEQAKPKDLIFVKGPEINYQMVYYAKRNILRYDNAEQAQELMQQFNASTALLISGSSRFKADSINVTRLQKSKK